MKTISYIALAGAVACIYLSQVTVAFTLGLVAIFFRITALFDDIVRMFGRRWP